jgi:phosphohistidine phosphatase
MTVRRLILLRHAKSSWSAPEMPDHDRPLSKRGERDAPLMGKRLERRSERPAMILTSDAQRALRTATIVAKCLGVESMRVESQLYLATPERLLAVVGRQDASLSSLLVVAHNPGLTELANQLLPTLDLDNLPTSGVIAIDFDAPAWADVAREPGTLAYYDYPKNPSARGV